MQVCKLAASSARQDRKFITRLQQVNANFEVTIRQTCSELVVSSSLQTSSKKKVRIRTLDSNAGQLSYKICRLIRKLPFPTENSLGNRRFDTIAAQLFINAASECDNCIQGQSENKRRTVMHYLHNGKFTESSKKRRIPDYGFGGHQNWLDQRGWDLAIRPENNIQGGDESYRFSSIHDLLYKGRM
ncbi:hypothetical protein AVEN_270416-1 [Araneus ventricosus]|uniref:Uncharacterized protein n=1 Tax=Araneus ventricosus TaxID=182803 RepID=A0A4Y2RGE5_ARAVE|nr:hypothetical protein AVEN_270416-1 [Araneus ventricosus]